MFTFLSLPSDILLLIVSTYLGIRDVFVFRRVCRELAHFTRDKIVWLTRLECLRVRGDTPLPIVDSAITPSSTLESIVVSATRVSDSWLLPRQINPILSPQHTRKIKGLKVFLETWLLIVYQDGAYLYDIRENAPRHGHCATLRIGTGVSWASHVAALGPGKDHIVFAISSARGTASGDTEYETHLYSLNFGADTFELFRTFKHSMPRKILAIDTFRRLLVFSSYTRGALGIVDWDDEENDTTIVLDDADTEEIVNDVVALRRIDAHFLVIRTRTIELYLCADAYQPQPNVPPLKHRLPLPLRDGAVSVSDVVHTQDDDFRITLLAYTGRSLACYTIAIELPEANAAGSAMNVTLIGEAHPPPATHPPWFVSAHALGPQGIRAMWIDRDQTMNRHVRLCTFNRNSTRHEMDSSAFSSTVFSLSSYDLRQDLTHCALAEFSGRIVLGNRAGAVFLLPLNQTE
ncbi:hypothetical protein C8R45DRAFT_996991 [Mycena sanguinolenta]|nr:hypothetical protein C8R45DRAFT_996991 [Mycena sanguinolenta]